MSDIPPKTGTQLSEEESRSIIASARHGVLSLGVENRGYGFPMSYRYDRERDRLVLGFINGHESKKEHFVTHSAEATLTVYEYEDVDSWRSVIVTGTVAEIDGPEVPPDLLPLFFLTDDGDEERFVEMDEYERKWYELRIEDVSGRHSGWP